MRDYGLLSVASVVLLLHVNSVLSHNTPTGNPTKAADVPRTSSCSSRELEMAMPSGCQSNQSQSTTLENTSTQPPSLSSQLTSSAANGVQPSFIRSLLASSSKVTSASAYLSMQFILWCYAHQRVCAGPPKLTYTWIKPPIDNQLQAIVDLAQVLNGTSDKGLSPASGLLMPSIGNKTEGLLCDDGSVDCYLTAIIPVTEATYLGSTRPTYVCLRVDTIGNITVVSGYPNGTGDMLTAGSKPVDGAISCQSSRLGRLFVATYLASGSGLDQYKVAEDPANGTKYLTLKLAFKSLKSMTASIQAAVAQDVRKAIALELGYLHPSANNTLMLGMVPVVTEPVTKNNEMKVRVYAPHNTTDQDMYNLYQRIVVSDGEFFFQGLFTDKYGAIYQGCGSRSQLQKHRSLFAGILASGAAGLVVLGTVYAWKWYIKNAKQSIAK